ncbi:MAG: hypothetical protein IPK85_13850 [Gemmatimonadetes bacterium]|nr:hypothetical protein [Gemmatimonadota bacterium]
MSRGARFAGTSVVLIGLAGAVLWMAYTFEAGRRAVLVAAVVALVVQGITWGIIRRMGPAQVMAAWGAGALVRAVALVAFAVLGPRLAGLPLEPAAISLAVFLFVTTLVEPLFLKS